MLQKPALQDERIVDRVQDQYRLSVEKITFLPLGADPDTAVYRVESTGETAHFLKLRRGAFPEAGVAVPKYLGDHGFKQVIPPLATRSGHLSAGLPPFRLILYPYVEGRNAFERKLSDAQWFEFGAALKGFHTADFPASITIGTQREQFSPRWRDTVNMFLEQCGKAQSGDPDTLELVALLAAEGRKTRELLDRAGRLAQILQKRPPEYILCHADIHIWNLLIDDSGALYMVDWDTLIFAPKERDLMFIGGGPGGSGHSPQEEEALFYEGYGKTAIDQDAIAYYRYERIIEDIAVYCDQIFLSAQGAEDRKQALKQLKSNFLPNGTIERAYRSDKT